MEASGDTSFIQTWLGYRKINSNLLGSQSSQNSKVISPWYKSTSNALPVAGYITNNQSTFLPYECTYIDGNIRQGYNCLNSDLLDTRAVCEYRHCTTLSGKYCTFPFIVGGREYDTCVPFGRADGTAWCGTSVDSFGHVLSNDTCGSACPVSACPVGFVSMLQTCIHISAAHPYDTVSSVQEAENVCMDMGARLYQPRSIASLRTLLFMNQPLFNKNYLIPGSTSNDLLGYDSSVNRLAIGVLVSQTYALTYRDGSPFDESLIDATQNGFAWSATYPDGSDTNICVVLQNKQEFANVNCSGLATGDTMSYICEARPFVTVDGLDPNKTCVFPFKIDASDVWHHSCIYGTNAKVGSNKVMKCCKLNYCIQLQYMKIREHCFALQ